MTRKEPLVEKKEVKNQKECRYKIIDEMQADIKIKRKEQWNRQR